MNPGRNSNGTAGWRLLGTKKVWRSDWTEYDNRQQRRASQQKTKEKAQKRKKANKHRGHNNSTNRKTNSIFSKTPSKHTRSKNERENMKNNTSQKWFNYNDSNMKRRSNGAVSNGLPSDKDLLAAAKLTFSKPPVKQRGIKFQRGEILNPYPVDDAFPSCSTSSSNWLFGPALRNSFSQHCSSCSCEKTCFRST